MHGDIKIKPVIQFRILCLQIDAEKIFILEELNMHQAVINYVT
jgi:hypothetical protein